MKSYLIVVLPALVFAASSFAEKPEWAGKGRPTAEQKDSHRSAMEAKEGLEDGLDEKEKKLKQEKIKKEKEAKQEHNKPKGLEKQEVKKSEQIQKEVDQGSEKGKESRQGRKKWWKFWGE